MSRKSNQKQKDFPLKIQYIENKKIQKSGGISYLVKYKDVQFKTWASKEHLTRDEENAKCIERYEKFTQLNFQADQDEPEQQDLYEQKQKLQMPKTKVIKKSKQNKRKQEQLKDKQYVDIYYQQQDDNEVIDKKQTQKNVKNQKLQKMTKLSEKQQKVQQKQKQKQKQAKLAEKKEQIMEKTQRMESIDKKGGETKVKPEAKFKIIKAKIDHQGKIEFQLKYENGISVWIDGDRVKKENPFQVIRFYEKRITWGC